ncbi:MAG TPA: hypothetical protein VMW16_06585, partial [Sedimentisphaerales bacterium]|nr:hypothetical protein [Sedimentisphaerales bacterium]
MYVKLASVICLALLAGSASATQWGPCVPDCINEYNWYTPNAWGAPPYCITAPFEGNADIVMTSPNCPAFGPRVDSDVYVSGRLEGPAKSGSGVQTMNIVGGTMRIKDRWYLNNSNGNGVAIINICGDAVVISESGSSNSMRCDSGGNYILTVCGNGTLIINGAWRNNDSGNCKVIEQIFTDNATVQILGEYDRLGDNGGGKISFLGNSNFYVKTYVGFNGRNAGYSSNLTIADNAEVYCGEDFWVLSTGPGTGDCNMYGGSVNCLNFIVAGNGTIQPPAYPGAGTFNMYAGLVVCRDKFLVVDDNISRTVKGRAYLNGGTVECARLEIGPTGIVDLSGGTLIIAGNALDQVHDLRAAGKLTGFGSPINVKADYNITNAGKTTVVGVVRNPKAAWNPSPPDTQVWVGSSANPVVCTWEGTHSVKDSHIVYFDTDLACVTNTPAGDMTSPCYKVRIPAGYPRIY